MFVGALLAVASHAHRPVEQQIRTIDELIRQAPTEVGLYLKRSELYRALRNWEAALADLDSVERLDPKRTDIAYARANVLLDAGRSEDAAVVLDRFLAEEPTHPGALVARARARAASGWFLPAAEDYSRALALLDRPRPEHFLERARAFVAAGDEHITEALHGLDEGLARFGPLVSLQLLAIELELRRGDYDQALARLEIVASQSSRRERWLLKRGEILALAARPDEARQALHAALETIAMLPLERRRLRAVQDLESEIRSALEALGGD